MVHDQQIMGLNLSKRKGTMKECLKDCGIDDWSNMADWEKMPDQCKYKLLEIGINWWGFTLIEWSSMIPFWN